MKRKKCVASEMVRAGVLGLFNNMPKKQFILCIPYIYFLLIIKPKKQKPKGMKDRLEQSDLEIFMLDFLSDATPSGYLSPPRKEPGIFPLLANCVNHSRIMGVIFKLHIPKGDYVYLDAVFSVGLLCLSGTSLLSIHHNIKAILI